MGEGKSFAKAILFGEHFVVHGTHAIGASLSNSMKVRITKIAANSISLNIETGQIVVDASRKILDSMGLRGNYFIEISTQFPASAGLGWSAAYSVALARAAAAEKGVKLTPQQSSEYAFEGERIFHGNPSGMDNALCALGGAMLFKRSEEPRPLKIGAPLHIVVAYTPRKAYTRELVAGVSSIKEEKPHFFTSLMEKEEKLVLAAKDAIENGDIPTIGKLMDINQEYLREIGVSSPELEDMIKKAKEGGAIGAKLTGAGGGGCTIALAKSKKDTKTIANAIGANYLVFEAKIG